MKIQLPKLLHTIFFFYYDGFKAMKLGKTLWIIIAIKLFVMFAIIKWIFFPDILYENFANDTQRGAYVLDHLTQER